MCQQSVLGCVFTVSISTQLTNHWQVRSLDAENSRRGTLQPNLWPAAGSVVGPAMYIGHSGGHSATCHWNELHFVPGKTVDFRVASRVEITKD